MQLYLFPLQYATFMILIVLVQLTIGGLAAIYKNDVGVMTSKWSYITQ